MCGEKMMKAGSNCAMLGSPPRMQGKGAFQILHHLFIRITPAYAGKRGETSIWGAHDQDHPRVCGEKVCFRPCFGFGLGSPPRMRGKAAPIVGLSVSLGITPAYAGKSRLCARGLTRARDHPRVCGEKWNSVFGLLYPWGSPPRMRGKEQKFDNDVDKFRITPAYAGKREQIYSLFRTRMDHPRVCGEKQGQPERHACGLGSPPRMRGKAL